MEAIFVNTENNKTSEPHKVIINFSQILDLRRQQYKNNKLKIIAPTWNDEFELHDGSYSVSDIQDYIENIIKIMKHYPLILLFIFVSIRLIKD